MKYFPIVFTVLVLLVSARDLGEIIFGENIPKCKRTQDEIQTHCAVEYYKTYIHPILVNGVCLEDYPGILEPFKVNEIPIKVARTGITVKGHAKNVTFTGLSNVVIKQVRYEYGSSNYHATVKIPKLELTCRYDAADSKFLFFSLETSGQFQGTFVNVEVELTGKMDTHIYNGMEFAVATSMQVSLSYGSGTTLHLEPNDTGTIAKLGVALVNYTPPRVVLFMFKHEITTSVALILQEKINEILSTLPLKLIFE